jgi:hypothetical protein
MGVTVTGADRLAQTMDVAAAELGRLPDAHRAVAALIVRAARPPRRTGRLAASIRAVADPDGAHVEAGAPYAAAVEAGVPSRGIRPQPFLRRAVESTRGRWEAEYLAGIQTALDDVRGA